jgi:hypothetical protein
MSRTLFAITDDLLALEALLVETGGDVTDERDAKLDAYCAVIREIEARSAARHAEAARIVALAEQDEREAKRLRERLHQFMVRTGTQRIDTERASIRVQQNGGQAPLVVFDQASVPEQYYGVSADVKVPAGPYPDLVEKLEALAGEIHEAGLRSYVVRELDKGEIRAALADGMSVPGVMLGERSTRLVLK